MGVKPHPKQGISTGGLKKLSMPQACENKAHKKADTTALPNQNSAGSYRRES